MTNWFAHKLSAKVLKAAVPGIPYIANVQLGQTMTQRDHIPAELERALMIEAGYRCAICKSTDALQIEHIREWAVVREHAFANMIVLCANCHGRKVNTSNPRHINRASLEVIKSNLMMLNGRYSDLERRVIDTFRESILRDPSCIPTILLPEQLSLLVAYIVRDGLVASKRYESTVMILHDDFTLREDTIRLTLTESGRTFLDKLNLLAS